MQQREGESIMTDYCNSGCQSHRPAATTNQYTPGHFSLSQTSLKLACTAHWPLARAHTHMHMRTRTHTHHVQCKCMNEIQSCAGAHSCISPTQLTHVHRQKMTETYNVESWGASYELQPLTEPNNLSVSASLDGCGSAK